MRPPGVVERFPSSWLMEDAGLHRASLGGSRDSALRRATAPPAPHRACLGGSHDFAPRQVTPSERSGSEQSWPPLAHERLAVLVAPEDVCPAVAASGDMINRVGKIDAWRARHERSIPRRTVRCDVEPAKTWGAPPASQQTQSAKCKPDPVPGTGRCSDLASARVSAILQVATAWSTGRTCEVPQMTQPTLPPGIRELPVPDRVALVEQIWDSIVEDQARFELTDAQKAELDRRLARRASSTSRGSDWEDVKRRILGTP